MPIEKLDTTKSNMKQKSIYTYKTDFMTYKQGSGTWPSAGLSFLKV